MFLHADSKDSDQTGRTSFVCFVERRLVYVELKPNICYVLCSGSEFFNEMQHGNCFLTQICHL